MKRAREALAPGRGGLVARGAVAAYVGVLVLIPLVALIAHGFEPGWRAPWDAVRTPVAWAALKLTLLTAAAVAIVNAGMGTATAWVLVRYPLPGKGLLTAIVDLPFAIPTLVAGLALVYIFGPEEPFGRWLGTHGVRVLFARPAIVLALAFITLPFVVRAVEPVLRELDPAEEEAATTLGAGPLATFRRVLLPALAPAMIYGTLQSFARALAEFGSIVVVSGNIPLRTLTAPVHVFAEVEGGRSAEAAGVSVVLLALALTISLGLRLVRGRGERTA